MANEKRLIDAYALMDVIRQHEYSLATKQGSVDYGMFTLGIQQAVDEQKTVYAVEVVRIEEVKQEILQTMDNFIEEYNRIGFYGKVDVMDIARRLVNAALTDLCSHGERIDGE